MRLSLALLTILVLSFIGHGMVRAEPVKTPHAEIELIPDKDGFSETGDLWVGVRIKPMTGWHTYWQNPGDTGQAPVIEWSLPEDIKAKPIQWPVPEILPYQGFIDYGYGHEHVLLVALHQGHSNTTSQILKARLRFLICALQCVPESADISVSIHGDARSGASRLKSALEALPQDTDLTATVQSVGNKARISIALPSNWQKAALRPQNGVYLFPETDGVFGYVASEPLDLGARGFTLSVPMHPGAKIVDQSALLSFKSGAVLRIHLKAGAALSGTSGLGGAPVGEAGDLTIFVAAGLAFVGGLILNLMPCVFPVLSLKLLAVSKAGHEGAKVRRESLLYGIGVVLSFLGLAALLLAVTATGQSVGWGFQLQSPWVTAGLAALMLAVALNMSGFFEFGTGLQNFGANWLREDRPALKAVLTGVLAVMVAAPCTAPFMASAIGFALAQGSVTAFVVFLALGLGFAAPIVIISYAVSLIPSVAQLMPRPGPWMTILQRVLAIPMFGASLWLIWVFSQQVSGLGLGLILAGLVLVALALGMAWRGKALIGLAGLILIGFAAAQLRPPQPQDMKPSREDGRVAFSLDRLQALRAQGRPVLVDMTAAWCITCKVNERLVLTRPEVLAAMKASGTVYMVGDWTNQDKEITDYLSLYNRSGVPLYVFYPAHQAEPEILPQVLDKADLTKILTAKN